MSINRKYLNQRGFSMVELMVAMVIGLFLISALVQVVLSGKKSFTAADHFSRLQENGRVTVSMLTSDLKRAGYMGGNSEIDTIYGSAEKEDTAATCIGDDTSWGRMVAQSIYGIDGTNVGYACISNDDYLRGDVLTVRYASPWVGGAFEANQLYLRSSVFQGKIFHGSDEALVNNIVTDQPQSVHELVAYAYFVGNSDRSCNGAAVPSLFRVKLDSNGNPETEELLPGVEDFQVQYGEAGQYVNADAVVDWDQVVSAQFWLLLRSECAETGFNDPRTYNLGIRVYTPGDSFNRQLYSSVVAFRN
ncbi:MAG: hypothetical protein DRQ43_11260 [Gammaproteobacteria bacterium]|nr:MAG: hypothetical protein DRQ43_11260 [Gammaproteobacteria bacterium]